MLTDDKELLARLRSADLYNAEHYERDPLHKQAADRIEALEAKLAKAVEGLHAVVQHEASTFFGPDGEKNKRASWRGVMRKVRTTLAEIKGERHE